MKKTTITKSCKFEGCYGVAEGRYQYCKSHNTDECKKVRRIQSGNKWKESNADYAKRYREDRLGYYIYKFINKNSKSLYVGSTCEQGRIRRHLTGNSNLQIRFKQWITSSEFPNEEGYGLSYVEVADVGNLVSSEHERLYLERLFILKDNPIINGGNPMDYLESKLEEYKKNSLKSDMSKVAWTKYNWMRTFSNNGILNENSELYNLIQELRDEAIKTLN